MSLFISHGAPTLLLDDTPAHQFLKIFGRAMPGPEAIIIVSAHWETTNPIIGAHSAPPLIRDFSGFPRALYTFTWPVTGNPELSKHVHNTLAKAGFPALLDDKRGLDHGAWVPLSLLDPDALIPVIPISLPTSYDTTRLWQLGQTLAALEKEGFLLIGSGSLTHNLRARSPHWESAAHPSVERFMTPLREALAHGDREALQAWTNLPLAEWHHPSPEHFLPLLIAAAADGSAHCHHQSTEYGVLAMDCWQFGETPTLSKATD